MIKVGEHQVNDIGEYFKRIQMYRPGATVDFVVERNGVLINLKAKTIQNKKYDPMYDQRFSPDP